jgi:hypothetical protein
MAIAYVTNSKSATANNTAGITTPITPTDGNILIGIFGNRAVNTTISSVTSPHATWTQIGNFTAASRPGLEIWMGVVSAPSGVETITVTWSGGSTFTAMVAEFSGVLTASAVDVAAASNNASSTSVTTGAYTTLNATDLILAAMVSQSATSVTDPASGSTPAWTSIGMATAGSGGSSRASQSSYAILASTGAQSAAWTDGNANWSSLIVALKAAAAATTTSTTTTSTSSSTTTTSTSSTTSTTTTSTSTSSSSSTSTSTSTTTTLGYHGYVQSYDTPEGIIEENNDGF